jgi:hypothetical protein
MIGSLFWLLTLVGCGYAAAAGGKDGRWAAGLIIAASLLTIPATRLGQDWAKTEYLILAVDLALLLGLYTLTLKSRSHFPIWMTGFHLIAVLTHVSTLLAPGFAPPIYRALGSLWAIPMTLAMMYGIQLDRRSGRSGFKARRAAARDALLDGRG